MRAWRIYDHNADYARASSFNPLAGSGGLHRPARWHHAGHPIIYAASSPSLAVLEVLVHETSESFRQRTLLQIEFEDDSETVTPQRLLRLLSDSPAGAPEQATRDFGSQWLEERRSLTLLVPSVVMPYEHNVIINPLHPRAKSLFLAHSDIISLDQRLLRSLGSG